MKAELSIRKDKNSMRRAIGLFIFLIFGGFYFLLWTFNYFKNYSNFYLVFKYSFIFILLMLEVFFIYSLVLIILKFKNKEATFILNEKGFFFKGIYKTGTLLSWDNISNYELVKFNGVDMIKVSLKNEDIVLKQYGIGMKLAYKFNKLLVGSSFLFDIASFGGLEEEVMKLINFYTKNS